MRFRFVSFVSVWLALGITLSAQLQIAPTQSVPVQLPLQETTLAIPHLPSVPNVQLTIGDLNGDDVPDLVFSNAISFLRVVFLNRSGTTLSVINHHDTLPYISTCTATGAGARARTAGPWALDRPAIFDIDLDGVNELIYLSHEQDPASFGVVSLRVYDAVLSPTTGWAMVPQSHNVVSLNNYNRNDQYWGNGCNNKAGDKSLYLRVGNFRGRAWPQDILVFGGDPRLDHSASVFAYDSGTASVSPSITELYRHGVNVDSGHNWRLRDTNFDGKDELFGRDVVEWDVAQSVATTLWSMDFSANGQPHGNNNHPDHVVALDFFDSYLRSSGEVVPSPGIEILAAPQTGGSNAVDPSGPWIYRAITGHSTGASREWPRKVVNYNFNGSGALYDYPSVPPMWQQPATTGTNPSDWDVLGTLINNNDPNVQALMVGQFVSGSRRPGQELLCASKGNLSVGSNCSGHTSYLFDSTNSLAALSWGQSDISNPGPSIWGARTIDIQGDRDTVEVVSNVGVTCSSASHFIGRYKTNPAGSPRYILETLYHRIDQAGESVGHDDGSNTADLFGDSREEYVFWRKFSGQSEVIIVFDPTPSTRNSPSPQEFYDYRRRVTNGVSYSQYVDFDDMEGLRFVTQGLPDATVGQAYGIVQDRNLDWRNSTSQRAGLIAVEGGVPPYTMTVIGNLPSGLSWSQIPFGVSGAPGTGSPYGGMIEITGVPSECITKRFTVEVVDGSSTSRRRDYWITSKHVSGVPCLAPTTPHIRAAGFDGTYLVAGQPGNLTLKVQVDDLQGDVAGISVFLNGALLLTETQSSNGLFTVSLPNVVLPPGSLFLQIVAVDQAGNLSRLWPYLTVPGAPNQNFPAFEPDAAQLGQTAANTPTIEWVELPPHNIPAGEKTDATGSQTVLVHIKSIPTGSTINAVTVRVRHNVEDVALADVVMTPTGNPLIYQGTFQPPAGWMGWGNYSVNAQVAVTDSSQVLRLSDWWPRLRAH